MTPPSQSHAEGEGLAFGALRQSITVQVLSQRGRCLPSPTAPERPRAILGRKEQPGELRASPPRNLGMGVSARGVDLDGALTASVKDTGASGRYLAAPLNPRLLHLPWGGVKTGVRSETTVKTCSLAVCFLPVLFLLFLPMLCLFDPKLGFHFRIESKFSPPGCDWADSLRFQCPMGRDRQP